MVKRLSPGFSLRLNGLDGAQQFGFLTDPVGSAETGSLQAARAGHSWRGGLNDLSSPCDRREMVMYLRNECQFAPVSINLERACLVGSVN